MRKVYVTVKVRLIVKPDEGETVEDVLDEADFEPRHPDLTKLEYQEVEGYEVQDSK